MNQKLSIYFTIFIYSLCSQTPDYKNVNFERNFFQPEAWAIPGYPEPGVDKHGHFNTSIPITDLRSKQGAAVSISLNYSSDIRYGQKSGWLGMGWSYNPGVITRSISGGFVPLGHDNQIADSPTLPDYVDFPNLMGNSNGDKFRDLYYLTLPSGKTVEFVYPENAQRTYVNKALNSTGKMTYGYKVHEFASVEGNYIIEGLFNGAVTVGTEKTSIMGSAEDDYQYFVVTDESGVKYIYSAPTLATVKEHHLPASTPSYKHPGRPSNYVNTWRIVAISSELFDKSNTSIAAVLNRAEIKYEYTKPVTVQGSSANSTIIQQSYLNKITTGHETIVFEYLSRVDFNSFKENSVEYPSNYISKIKKLSNGTLIKEFEFKYKQPTNIKRYYLEEIIDKSSGKSNSVDTFSIYKFTYYKTDKLPSYAGLDPVSYYENINGYYYSDQNAGQIKTLIYPNGKEVNIAYDTVNVTVANVTNVKFRVVKGARAEVRDDNASLLFNGQNTFKYSRVHKVTIKTQNSNDFVTMKKFAYSTPFMFGIPKNAFSKYGFSGSGDRAVIQYKNGNGQTSIRRFNAMYVSMASNRTFDNKVYYSKTEETIDDHTKIQNFYTTRNDNFFAPEVFDKYTILNYGQFFVDISATNFLNPHKGQLLKNVIMDLTTGQIVYQKEFEYKYPTALEPLLSTHQDDYYLQHSPYDEALNYYRSHSGKYKKTKEYKNYLMTETSYDYNLYRGITLQKTTKLLSTEGIDPSLNIKSRLEVNEYKYAHDLAVNNGTDVYSEMKRQNLVSNILNKTSNILYEKNGEVSYEEPIFMDSVKTFLRKTLKSRKIEYSFLIGSNGKLKLSNFREYSFEWLSANVKVYLNSISSSPLINHSHDGIEGSTLPSDLEIDINSGTHKLIIVITGSSLVSSIRGEYTLSFDLLKREKLKYTSQTLSEVNLYKKFNKSIEADGEFPVTEVHRIFPYKSFIYRGLPDAGLSIDYDNLSGSNWLLTKELESVNDYWLPKQIKYPTYYERIYYSSDKGQNNPRLDDKGYLPTAKVISMNNIFSDPIDIKTELKYNNLDQITGALNGNTNITVDYDKHHRLKSVRKNGEIVQSYEYGFSSENASYNPANPNYIKNTKYFTDTKKLVSIDYYNGHQGLIQRVFGNNYNFRISEPIYFEKSLNKAQSNILHMIDREIEYQADFINGKVDYLTGIPSNSILYQQQENTDLQGNYPYSLSLKTADGVRTELIPPGKHPIENRSVYRNYQLNKKDNYSYDEQNILSYTENSNDGLALKTVREKGKLVYKTRRNKKFNESMSGELSFEFYSKSIDKVQLEYNDSYEHSPAAILVKLVNLRTSAELSYKLRKTNKTIETSVLEPGKYKLVLDRPGGTNFTVGLSVKFVEYEKVETLSEIRYQYDDRYNLVKIVHPDPSQATEYEYNHKNELVKKTLASQTGSHEYKYDKFGRLRFAKDPNGNFFYTKYDAFGRTLETGLYKGSTTFANADPELNFPVSNTENKVRFFYDSPYAAASQNIPAGKLSAKVDANNISYYSYNNSGLIEWMEEKENSISLKKFTFNYDRLGNVLSSQNYILGNLISTHAYGYNIFGELIQVKENNETLATYSYNPNGSVKSLNLGQNLQKIDYSYNPKGWLTDINKNLLNNDQFQLKLRYYGNDVSSRGISQNYDGNISYLESNRFDGNRFVQLRTGYKYDRFNRLKESFSFGSNGGRNFVYDTSYSYDIMGNITNLSRKGVK